MYAVKPTDTSKMGLKHVKLPDNVDDHCIHLFSLHIVGNVGALFKDF